MSEPIIHEVDGIGEMDSKLPRWWLYGMYATVVFAIVYWFAFHTFGALPGPIASYKQAKARALFLEGERLKALSPDVLIALSKDPEAVARGKEVFESTCASCHLATGGGKIGPNLTDKYWIHGGKPNQILLSVYNGWPLKGMPSWGMMIGPDKVKVAVAYVLTLRNSNVAGGKPPQGEPE